MAAGEHLGKTEKIATLAIHGGDQHGAALSALKGLRT